MKKSIFCALVAACLGGYTAVQAESFSVDGIGYNTLTANTVEMTKAGTTYAEEMTIPATVTHNGTTYTVTKIAKRAFYSGYLVKKVTFPNTLDSIVEPFYDMGRLTTVNLGSGVKVIEGYFQTSCPVLATINVDPANPNFTAVDNVLYNKDMTHLVCYAPGKTETSYIVPSTVKTMQGGAISWNNMSASKLTSLTLNEGLESLGMESIKNAAITSLILPESLTEIYMYGCYGLRNCAKIKFGSKLTAIGRYAFCYLGENTQTGISLDFPATLKSIDDGAFGSANKLNLVQVHATTPPSLPAGAFTDKAGARATLVVPGASLSAYKSSNWGRFSKIIAAATTENSVEAEYTGPARIDPLPDAVIPVLIKNTGTNTVTSIEYSVSIDGQEGEYSFDNIEIPPYTQVPYQFPASLLPKDKHNLVVNIHTVNGVDNTAANKTLTISLELAEPVVIPDDAPMATYSNFTRNTRYGGGYNHFDVGHLFADPQLVGKKVVGIKIDGINKSGVSNAKVWYSKSLLISEGKFTPNGEAASVNVEADGSVKAGFSEPATLTSSGLYFGISLDNNPDASGADKWPVSIYYTDAAVNRSFMFHPGNESYFEDLSEDGVLGVTLYLENGVTVPAKALISSVDGHKANMPGKTSDLTVTWQNWSGATVTSLDYSYTINGTTHNESITLPKTASAYLLQPHTFTMTLPAPTNAGEYPVEMCITKVNSTANPSVDEKSSFNYYVGSFQTNHKPMVEEFTGTGCGWCPRGTLAMNEMAKAYPDFISAVYHGFNSSDPMYINKIPGIFSGSAPAGIMDRKSGEIDPYYGTGNSQLSIKKDYEAYRDLLAPADMGLEATLNADSTITATGSMVFSYVDNGYALCFLITIDGLNHQNDPDSKAAWTQGNSYSGSNSDPLINSLCNGSYDLNTFNHVVIDCTRAVNSNHWLKSNFQVGKTYSATNTFNLNNCSLQDKSWLKGEDWSKINVIAFLKDDNGGIGNAVKVRLGQKIDAPTGIESVEAATEGEAQYYDLMGRRVQNPENGIFVKVQGNKATKVAL